MRAAVVVDELTAGGNAEQAGVQVGDILSEVSAVVLKAGKEGQYEREGYGQRPFDNFQKVMTKCEGAGFDTVLGAIRSNNEQWGYRSVDLVIRRPA